MFREVLNLTFVLANYTYFKLFSYRRTCITILLWLGRRLIGKVDSSTVKLELFVISDIISCEKVSCIVSLF